MKLANQSMEGAFRVRRDKEGKGGRQCRDDCRTADHAGRPRQGRVVEAAERERESSSSCPSLQLSCKKHSTTVLITFYPNTLRKRETQRTRLFSDMGFEERRSRSSSRGFSWVDHNHSLLSMRTYYAFGARSSCLSSRSMSASPSSTSTFSALSPFPTLSSAHSTSYRSADLVIPRCASSTFPSLSDVRRYPSPRSRPRPSRIPFTPSSPRLPPLPRQSYRPPLGSTFSSLSIRSSPSTFRRSSPAYQSSASQIPSTSTYDQVRKIPSSKDEDTISEAYNQTVSAADPPQPPSTSNNDAELEDLRKRTKSLEDEMARLRLKLKDSDRSNRELKRKLLESEAETKVWKAKSERLPATKVIEITRNGSDVVDTALFDQLDSAADKLSRLNAVNDLKMLQSHMENAIMEITK